MESESTKTHSHFIGILDNVVQILSPTSATSAEEQPKDKGTTAVEVASLSNRFSIINVEDTEDILDSTAIAVSRASDLLPLTNF